MSNFILDLAKAVVEIAAENPDYVYENPDGHYCLYTRSKRDSEKGCLIGQGMIRVDDSYEAKLRSLDENYGTLGVGPMLEVLVGIKEPDEGLLQVLGKVQASQDEGTAWGEAVQPLVTYLRYEGLI